MQTSALIIGRTYYRLTFADPDLTMPGVEPVVFLKQATDEDGTTGFVFQDTVSFVMHGSGLEGDEQHEDIQMYFMDEESVRSLYGIDEIAVEVTESARRAAALNYPVLTPLRDS